MADNKQYTWSPEAEIKMTGNEFGMMLNALKAFTVSPLSPMSFLAVNEVTQFFEVKLKKMIEDGVATEAASPEDDVIEVEAIPE